MPSLQFSGLLAITLSLQIYPDLLSHLESEILNESFHWQHQPDRAQKGQLLCRHCSGEHFQQEIFASLQTEH